MAVFRRFFPLCMVHLAAVACVTVLVGAALGQAEGPTGPETAAAERPFVKGQLTASSVRVRSGPGTQYPIYYKADMPAEVRVVGRKGQWLEVEFPARKFSYVTKEYLQPIDTNTAIVTGTDVNVRTGPGIQFDEVYAVQAGHKFRIFGTDPSGQWYRVEPMPGATTWIIDDYVRLSGPIPGEEPAPTPSPPPPPPDDVEPTPPTPTPALPAESYAAKMAEAEKAFKAQTEKENPVEWDLAKIEELYTDVEANAKDPVLRLRARKKLAQVKAYATIKQRATSLGNVDDELKARLAELEKERQREISIAEAAGSVPFVAVGELEKFYIPGLGNATHKLVDNGRIVYLLRSDVLDFKPYEGKFCGIRGSIVSVPAVTVQIIEATNAIALPGQTD